MNAPVSVANFNPVKEVKIIKYKINLLNQLLFYELYNLC